jgi:hypothetical protein
VHLTVEEPRERHRRDAFRLVAGLDQRGDSLLAKPIQFLFRERGALHHVGHDRQRRLQALDRDVQADRGRVEGTARRERCPDELDGVGDLERAPAAGAFVEHRHREVRQAELHLRVVRAANEGDEVHLHDGNFMRLDDPDRQTVGEGAFLDAREVERRRGAERGRLTAIRLLRPQGHEDGWPTEDAQHTEDAPVNGRHRVHGLASGSTISSTRLSGGSHRTTAACTSLGERDVYRARSSAK